jgi:hypothetical protein
MIDAWYQEPEKRQPHEFIRAANALLRAAVDAINEREREQVPLDEDDILVTTQFRLNGDNARLNYSYVDKCGVWWACGGVTGFRVLMEDYKRTDDSGKTWRSCSKPEVKR